MAKRELIHKDNFWVDLQIQTPISIAMERNTITEQEIVKPYLDKIRAEIEPTRKMYFEMNDVDWINGCDYVLSIIDKYKAREMI